MITIFRTFDAFKALSSWARRRVARAQIALDLRRVPIDARRLQHQIHRPPRVDGYCRLARLGWLGSAMLAVVVLWLNAPFGPERASSR